MAVKKRKDRGYWEFVFDLEKGPDDKRRQVKKGGYATKRLAEEAEAEERGRQNLGLAIASEKLTVREYLAGWMEHKKPPRLEESTWLRYEQLLRLHLLPMLGSTELRKLRPRAIQACYAAMEKKGLSARTALQAHAILHGALDQAVRWEYIGHNVADAVERPKAEDPVLHMPTPAEVRALLEKGDETRFGLIYRFSLSCGLRQGEVVALSWQQVDMELAQVTISRGARRFKGRGMVIKGTKGNRARSLALSKRAMEMLQLQKRRQAEEKMRERLDYANLGLVFADPLGRTLNADTVRRVWQREVAGPLGLADVRLHDLRHRHLSTLMAMAESPKMISERAGHSSTSFTQDVYGHLRVEEQREAVERFEEAIFGVL